jgi:O-antigen ligase
MINVLMGGSIAYTSAFLINIILLICLANTSTYSNLALSKVLTIYSSIHLFFTIFVAIIPEDIVNNLFIALLRSSYWTNWDWRVRQNSNVGITTQPGNNALYLTILLAILTARIITYNKDKKNMKIIYYVCFILTFIGIILTNKRAPLIFNFLTIIIIFLLYKKSNRFKSNNILKVYCFLLIGTILFIAVYKRTGIFTGIIEKNALLNASNDITNGRLALWGYALDKFNEKPVFGVGLKSIYNAISVDVHNVYLQLLAETGIIGFTIFMLALFVFMIKPLIEFKNLKYTINYINLETIIIGLYLMIYLVLYGTVSNIFIDYIPLTIFICSVSMANSFRFMEKNNENKCNNTYL